MKQTERVQRYLDPEVEAAMARVEAVARLMDGLFEVPGTRERLGLDAIIGLVPVLGDLVSQIISSYIIWEARQLGVSRFTIARMVTNSLIDTAVGMVPFAGDAFDVVFRANLKNLALLRAHVEKHGAVRSTKQDGIVIEGTARRVG